MPIGLVGGQVMISITLNSPGIVALTCIPFNLILHIQQKSGHPATGTLFMLTQILTCTWKGMD